MNDEERLDHKLSQILEKMDTIQHLGEAAVGMLNASAKSDLAVIASLRAEFKGLNEKMDKLERDVATVKTRVL